jgi:transglutaminase-like putative cysteine protease
LATVGVTPSAAATGLTPLYVVPTEDRLQVAMPDDRPLLVEFDAVNRERLLAALGSTAVPSGRTSVRLALEGLPATARKDVEDPSGRWLAASFIVDHDQPTVDGLRAEFLAAAASSATVRSAELVAFVDRKVDAVPGQGWEPASQTARTLRGDCTEHAVLTVALARSLGIPARVVVGMVIVRPGTQYVAMGHAWAELRDDDRWTVADAALGPMAAQARYVPLGLLEDEGPGFLLQLLDTLNAWVSRVVVLGPND